MIVGYLTPLLWRRHRQLRWRSTPGGLPSPFPIPTTATTRSSSATEQFSRETRRTMDISWMAAGSCRQVPPETMFPTDSAGVIVARGVCADCPVRSNCLDYALANRIKEGVWGGTSSRQRTRINRSRRAEASAARNAPTNKTTSPSVSQLTQSDPSWHSPGDRPGYSRVRSNAASPPTSPSGGS